MREGEKVLEIPREGGFKPLSKWVERIFACIGQNRGLGKDYEYPPFLGNGSLGRHDTLAGEAAGQGRIS
ncbi:hypothetical protein CSW37_12150 [Thermus scotoductus]|uniref:Uncharacterized protein n=1 Tax=Thermus scotoductus TaxID=37636 RepID=A0A430S946_THESC|nr:hypothetical protein CSW37_12150 [Thermus scotoductus]